jgi:hypothetical protein
MLSRMRDGLTPDHVPAADVDVAVELPSVEVEIGSEVRTKPFTPTEDEGGRGRSHMLLVALGALGVIAILGLGVYWAGAPTNRVTDAEEVEPPVVAPAMVDITVDSEPPGATVFVDDREEGTTPTTISMPTGTDVVPIRLELEGHSPSVQEVVPDVDQRIAASLRLLDAPSVREQPETTMRRSSRGRRRSARMNEGEPAVDETPEPTPTDPDGRERAFRRFN